MKHATTFEGPRWDSISTPLIVNRGELIEITAQDPLLIYFVELCPQCALNLTDFLDEDHVCCACTVQNRPPHVMVSCHSACSDRCNVTLRNDVYLLA